MADVPRLGSGIPMIGRGPQLRTLRAALDRASGGSATAVLMSGDAGVGKSRLLDELVTLARVDGMVVLTGRCLDIGESGLSYLPFAEAISALPRHWATALQSRRALGRLVPGLVGSGGGGTVERDVHPTPQQPLVDAAPGATGVRSHEPDTGQLQLFDAVHGLLTELAGPGGALLAIEDLHWADRSTRDLLSFLLARLRHQRLLVVATYRSDDLHRRHPLRPLLAELFRLPTVERLDLRPFGPAEATEFVAALADESMPEDVVQQVAQRSEGNAFFAEELVAAFSSPGRGGIPAALADVLLARFERLSPGAQRVVRVAAVAGRRVRYSRLPAAAGLPELELEEALREAVQHNVLRTVDADEVYEFRHALLAEAVYGDLLPGERVRLHAAYANELAAEPDQRGAAAELAYHAVQSNNLTQALSASVRAADEAFELNAPAEALHHLEQALKLWEAVPDATLCCGQDELTLLRQASSAAGRAGQPERAIAYGRSAVRAADERDDPRAAADARRSLTQHLLAIDGTDAAATEAIEQAWRLLDRQPPTVTTAWVLAIRAMIRYWTDRRQGRELAEQAVLVAQRVGAGDAEADALITLARMDEADGRPDQAYQRLLVARRRAAEAGALNTELRAISNAAINRYEQAELAGALAALDDGVRRAAEVGLALSRHGLGLRMVQAVVRYVTGDWDGSALAAEPPSDAASGLVAASVASTGLAVAVGRGQFADAAQLIAQLRPKRYPDLLIALFVGAAGAELESWRGHPERAVEHVDGSVQQLAELVPDEVLLAGIRLAALGVSAAADLAQRARRRRDADAEQAAVATGRRLLAQAGETAEAGVPRTGCLGPEGTAWLARARAEATRLTGPGEVAAWQAVVDAFGYGHRYEQAIARWRLAGALLAADRREDAAGELRQAAGVADQLGAVPLARAVKQLARRARISLPAGAANGGPDGASDNGGGPGAAGSVAAANPLTPRELAVLRQVALGRTNRQVGEELYISEKTVSVHLSRIMAKLDAGSRTEAVAAGYDRGLLTPGN